MSKYLAIFSLLAASLSANEVKEPAPCPSVEYLIYGELLFLQPNSSDLIYAMQANPKNPALAVPLVEANWFSHEINPSYHPAFEIGAKFMFKNIEMNLALDWERLSGSDSKHLSVPSNEAMLGPLFDIGPDAEIYINAKGKAVFHFDMVDVILEKRIFSKHQWTIDLCAGASFSRIKQSMKSKYFNDGATTARVIKSPSEFMGAGPKFGIDFGYELVKHLQFIGSTSISLFMGQLKNKTTYESFSPDLATIDIPQPNTERTKVSKRTQLVPGFDEKLGFAVDIPFSCGKVLIEAGYQFQIFLNAVQSLDMTVIVNANVLPPPLTSTGGYYAQGFNRTLSNFMLTGPYLRMSVNF